MVHPGDPSQPWGAPTPPPPPWGSPAWGPTGPERSTAMWAHLGALLVNALGCGVLGWIVPVVIRNGTPTPFVKATADHALNLALTQMLVVGGGSVVAILLSLVLIGFFLLPVVAAFGIAYLIIQVIACTKANAGELYKPPLTISFVAV